MATMFLIRVTMSLIRFCRLEEICKLKMVWYIARDYKKTDTGKERIDRALNLVRNRLLEVKMRHYNSL